MILTSSFPLLWFTSVYFCNISEIVKDAFAKGYCEPTNWVWCPSFDSILNWQSASGNDCGRKGEERQDRSEVLHDDEVKVVSVKLQSIRMKRMKIIEHSYSRSAISTSHTRLNLPLYEIRMNALHVKEE